MNCRKFKSNHVGFIDDLLSAADMADMRRHLAVCAACAALDTSIRRSLLIVRNLPQIQPSADFFARLSESLKDAPPSSDRRQPFVVAATFTAVTAALAAAVFFAMAFTTDHAVPEPSAAATATVPAVSTPLSDMAIAAAVPAGIPVWPAMFMVGELPTHVANAELLDSTLGR